MLCPPTPLRRSILRSAARAGKVVAMTLRLLAAVAAGLVALYLGLLVALLLARPRGAVLREAARLLPDLLRLVARLARDRSLPRGVRVRLWLLLGYLALPIDLIPDVIPVIRYAD